MSKPKISAVEFLIKYDKAKNIILTLHEMQKKSKEGYEKFPGLTYNSFYDAVRTKHPMQSDIFIEFLAALCDYNLVVDTGISGDNSSGRILSQYKVTDVGHNAINLLNTTTKSLRKIGAV